MKNVMKLTAVVFVLFAGLSSPRASAITLYCSDICSSGQSCGRNCSDDATGHRSSCGAYGCCNGNTSNC